MRNTILVGDVREQLRTLPDESVNCVVTSPPYWGLRDYGTASWEGGDEGCDHKNGPLASSKSTLQRYTGPDVKLATGGMPYRDACGKCGAVRVDNQLGLEATPEQYVCSMVEVFREVRRVLRKDGTLFLNLGDSYAGSGRGMNADGSNGKAGDKQATNQGSNIDFHDRLVEQGAIGRYWVVPPPGLKPKDLVGIPWRVAFALQADGWWLRSDIIWSKPNPMPESVTDRPTKAHEYVFLLSKSQTYYYDADAIKQPASPNTHARLSQASLHTQKGGFKQEQYEQGFPGKKNRDRRPAEILKHMAREAGIGPKSVDPGLGIKSNKSFHAATVDHVLERNRRTVWEVPEDEYLQFLEWKAMHAGDKSDVWDVATQPYPEAHFATYPEELVKPCIQAGCPEGGVVLDPFLGSGTTALVALKAGRDFVGVELNPEYVALAEKRIEPYRWRLL